MTKKPKAGKKKVDKRWCGECGRDKQMPTHVCPSHEHGEKCLDCYGQWQKGFDTAVKCAPKPPTVVECKHPAPTPIVITQLRWTERMVWIIGLGVAFFWGWASNVNWMGGPR